MKRIESAFNVFVLPTLGIVVILLGLVRLSGHEPLSVVSSRLGWRFDVPYVHIWEWPISQVLIGVVALIAWILLRRSHAALNRRNTPMARLSPIILSPREQKGFWTISRVWLDRNRIFFDVVGLAIIGTAVAVFAAIFAFQTEQIDAQQTKLIKLQAEIQQGQALPYFLVTSKGFDGPNHTSDSVSFVLTNKGGMARNLSANCFTLLTLSWNSANGQRMLTSNVPVEGYCSEPEIQLMFGSEQAGLDLGDPENNRKLNELMHAVQSQLVTILGASPSYRPPNLSVSAWSFVDISYQDYQGTNRDELYSLTVLYYNDYSQTLAMSKPTLQPFPGPLGQSFSNAFYNGEQDGYYFDLVFWDEDQESYDRFNETLARVRDRATSGSGSPASQRFDQAPGT